MSNINTARRTEVRLKVEGIDVTAEINKDLISFTYTDYAEDNADDIRITIDDRDGKWLSGWLNSSPETLSQNGSDTGGYKIGDIVYFNGGTHFYSSTETVPRGGICTAGYAKITNIAKGTPHPYHLIGGAFCEVQGNSNVYGWVNESQISKISEGTDGLPGTAGNSEKSENGSGEVNISIGDTVAVKNGAKDYDGIQLHDWVYSYAPGFTVLEISRTKPDRIVIGIGDQVTAAVSVDDILLNGRGVKAGTPSNKGLNIQAVIAKLNFNSDGKDYILDCGSFEADEISAKGPPQTVTIKATALSYTSTLRNQLKTKAWESIKLSAVAEQIAAQNGFECMFLSAYDPLYARREQIQESDITFLSGLCRAAGVSLKCTAKMLVLFDGEDYEQRDAAFSVVKGKSDVKTFGFNTGLNDTAYSSCHVSYTDPATGNTIEYTYTPKNGNGSGQVLEVNEKAGTKEEARQLAMKRLRQKNKKETTARFTLVGNTGIAAGCTVSVEGYGMFDGKYIIDTATHNVTGSGYTTEISCTKALEGY